jgi:hypothetical protein
MRFLKQSTARNLMVFLVDSTDHVTGKTGLTLTITASKDGGALGSITPTVTERGTGWYNLALTTAHTDTLGDLALHITGTAADPLDLALQVVAFDPASATNLGLSNLDVAISSRASPTQVNAELLDVFNTDTFGESASVPAAGSTLIDKIKWLFTLARNKITQTATVQTLRNDADSGTIATAPVSDDATTFTRGEWT